MTIDPKDLAVQRFGAMSPLRPAMDVITRYATDPPVVIASLLDALRPTALRGATIAELGFGGGRLLEAMAPAFAECRVVGLDLSPAMARGAQAKVGDSVAIMLGDMERLPFRDGSLDAIVTCWTLYFMRDIDAAIEEMKRCLRPGGIFVAATVAPDNMHEYAAMGAAAARVSGADDPAEDMSGRFDTETGGGIHGAPFRRRHARRLARRDDRAGSGVAAVAMGSVRAAGSAGGSRDTGDRGFPGARGRPSRRIRRDAHHAPQRRLCRDSLVQRPNPNDEPTAPVLWPIYEPQPPND